MSENDSQASSLHPIVSTKHFPVKVATANGAEIHFKDGDDWLFNKDGTKFKMDVYGRLYYLTTVQDENVDEVYGVWS